MNKVLAEALGTTEENLENKTILRKMADWYNPFEVNGKQIEDIHFFDENGIQASTGRGWFGQSNNPYPTIIFNFKTTNKRKPDFTLKHGFLLPTKSRYATDKGNKDLYLPLSQLHYTIECNKVGYEGKQEIQYFDRMEFEARAQYNNDPTEDNIIEFMFNFRYKATDYGKHIQDFTDKLNNRAGLNLHTGKVEDLLEVADVKLKSKDNEK